MAYHILWERTIIWNNFHSESFFFSLRNSQEKQISRKNDIIFFKAISLSHSNGVVVNTHHRCLHFCPIYCALMR